MAEYFLSISVALSALISASGLALDKLTLNHQNSKLKDRLVAVWLRVEEIRIRDVALAMATHFIAFEKSLFGPRLSYLWVLRVALFSIILTSITIIGGRALSILLIDILNPETSNVDLLISLQLAWGWFFYNVDHILIYPTNILFDQITLLATVALLTLYTKANKLAHRYIFILIDIVIAFVLFNIFYLVAQQLDSTASMQHSSYLPLFSLIGDIWMLGYSRLHIHLSTLCFVATVVLPTFIYLLMIFLAMLAKSSADLGRFILLQFTELGATGEKTIFFYTGIFFGLIVSISGLLVQVLSSATSLH